MKFLDRVLRDYRIKVTSKYIKANDRVLDIGCSDGYLFEKLKTKPLGPSVGLDPLLNDEIVHENYRLIPGKFPYDLPSDNKEFDCITMLAVLEHIPRDQQKKLNNQFNTYLRFSGRIIITVPSPFVDYILWVLCKLHLIDGMSVEEHYGFKVGEVTQLIDSNQFKLLKHKKFQLGLNNLFVFEKK